MALGSQGGKVYVTGRSEKTGDASLPGTIYETAAAVTAADDERVAVRIEHADDMQVKALFDRIRNDDGALDILVNNACALHDRLTVPGKFWEKNRWASLTRSMSICSSFVASYYAAPIMAQRGHSLIMFTSASGSVHYVYGPPYGAHKSGMGKFAAHMAEDLRPSSVAAISIWLGALRGEHLKQVIDSDPPKYKHLEKTTETHGFTGHIIWSLFKDPRVMALSGQTVIGKEMAALYASRTSMDDNRSLAETGIRLHLDRNI